MRKAHGLSMRTVVGAVIEGLTNKVRFAYNSEVRARSLRE